MNTNHRRVPTRFAPETRFEVTPVPAEPTALIDEAQFERLKERLLFERFQELRDRQFRNQILRAANEAAAIAWVTPYPVLVFPALFEEKAQAMLISEESRERRGRDKRDLLVV